MTEKRKRKLRNKKITNYNKNKNKITIQIDNSKTTKGRAKKRHNLTRLINRLFKYHKPYPIYQQPSLSLADVINSISQKNRQEEVVKEMRPKKEMTIDEEIPQYMATPIKKKKMNCL